MDAFAEMIDEGMKRKCWGYARLSVEIGVLPSGGIFNSTQIRRLRLGERRNLTRELVERLVQVLDLPEEEAWHAAGLWPPDLDIDAYRRYRHRLAVVGASSGQPKPTTGRFAGARTSWHRPGQRPLPDRRRRERRDRRGLYVVTQDERAS
jgi:hypothetical protein